MEEFNKKDLETLFQQKVPKYKMPLSTKWRIKLHNSRLSAAHWINAQFPKLKMAQLRPALVPLIGIMAFWLLSPQMNQITQEQQTIVESAPKTHSTVESSDSFNTGQDPIVDKVSFLWGGADQVSNPFGRSAIFNFEDVTL